MHQVGGIDVIEDVILMQLMMDGVVGIVDIGATDYPMAFLLELGENFQAGSLHALQPKNLLPSHRSPRVPSLLCLLCYETAVPV